MSSGRSGLRLDPGSSDCIIHSRVVILFDLPDGTQHRSFLDSPPRRGDDVALAGLGVGKVDKVLWVVVPGGYAHDNSARVWLVDFIYKGPEET